MVKDWPAGPRAVFTSAGRDLNALSRAAKRGDLRRLAPGLYTRNQLADPKHLVLSNIYSLIASYAPDAVLVDRSAFGPPLRDDEIFIASDERTTDIDLPGVCVRVRAGTRVPGDLGWSDGLALSSRGRAVLDNLVPSRRRAGRQARTLTAEELTAAIAGLAARHGAGYLDTLASEVWSAAEHLDHPRERVEESLELLKGLAGRAGLPAAAAVSARLFVDPVPADPDRVAMFKDLAELLAQVDGSDQPAGAGDGTATMAFYEAYLSNYIEGTIFTLDEALDIIISGEPPAVRPEDGHDILGTYSVVIDPIGRSATPGDAEEFIDYLRRRHAEILRGRPTLQPGEFKTAANRAGRYEFVRPEYIRGTLRAGYEHFAALDGGWARALMTMFVVSEVHPFTDGNGRLARVMMNAELSSAGLCRVLVPVRFRDEYLAAMRGLSRQGQADRYVRVMDTAWRWTAGIDFTDPATARGQMEATNALVDPQEGDDRGLPLRML